MDRRPRIRDPGTRAKAIRAYLIVVEVGPNDGGGGGWTFAVLHDYER